MESFAQPMVLMIGGGIQQVPAVATAQGMGFRVAVTDINPDAPCMALVDEGATISCTDLDGLADYALTLKGAGLVGVFTLTEFVEGACHAGQVAGLPGASLDSARLTKDKSLMKARWYERGVACPKGVTIVSLEGADKFLDTYDGPMFIKPATGFGGQGCCALDNPDAVREFVRAAWKGESGAPFILEERIEGPMYDVNGHFDATGRYRPLGVVRRRFLDSAPVEVSVTAPSGLDAVRQEELHSLLERGVRALGIADGPVKGDAVLGDDGFRLLEVAPRLHGPKSTVYTLPFAGQPQLEPVLLDFAGRAGAAQRLHFSFDDVSGWCECRTLRPVGGVITGICGERAVRQIPGVEHVVLLKKQGDRVGPYRDNTDIAGFISVSRRDRASLDDVFDQVGKALTFEIDGKIYGCFG